MRYRRRTVEVSAEQFRTTQKPWPETVELRPFGHYVETKSGPFKVCDGDWIVTHDDGLITVVRDALFHIMFNAVE